MVNENKILSDTVCGLSGSNDENSFWIFHMQTSHRNWGWCHVQLLVFVCVEPQCGSIFSMIAKPPGRFSVETWFVDCIRDFQVQKMDILLIDTGSCPLRTMSFIWSALSWRLTFLGCVLQQHMRTWWSHTWSGYLTWWEYIASYQHL